MAQLRGGTPTDREAATARLRVIGARAIDRLAALARSDAPRVARTAAIEALEGIDDPRARTLLEHLRAEDPSMAARAADEDSGASLDSPEGMRDWIAHRGGTAPLSELHDAIVRLRDRERDAPSGRRPAWQAARGAAHQALAQRGSRVALYDLRETFEAAAGALPAGFAAAAAAIGDASCLEALAKSWAAADKDHWWRDRVGDAARAIVAREKLTNRSGVVKRVRARHPGFLERSA